MKKYKAVRFHCDLSRGGYLCSELGDQGGWYIPLQAYMDLEERCKVENEGYPGIVADLTNTEKALVDLVDAGYTLANVCHNGSRHTDTPQPLRSVMGEGYKAWDKIASMHRETINKCKERLKV